MEIKDAILLVSKGYSFLTPSITRKVINYFAPLHDNTEKLSPKEQQVVAGIIDGLSYKLIADRLSVKVATIQGYVKSIYKKLNVHSKTEVINKVKKRFFKQV